MSLSLKNELSSDFEADPSELKPHPRVRMVNAVHNIRVAMTILALLAGIVTLGLSADTLVVYNATHLPYEYLLPLWPENFDLRPTNALVAGSAIITAMNIVSILASKMPSTRERSLAHASVSMILPIVAFIGSLVVMVLFYAVDTSTVNETYQSWVCRWKSVSMATSPDFGTLCRKSQAALALTVILVPLELIIVATACFQTILEKEVEGLTRSRAVLPCHEIKSEQ